MAFVTIVFIIFSEQVHDPAINAMTKKNGRSTTTEKVAKKWTWRKPKGKPKRPLSAYNIFFQEMRPIIMAHPAVSGFGDLAKVVAAHWKNLSPPMKRPYEEMAWQEMQRYKIDVSIWEKNRSKESNSVTPPPPSEDDAAPKLAALLAPSNFRTVDPPPSAWNDVNLLSTLLTPEPTVGFGQDSSSFLVTPSDPLEPLPAFDAWGTSTSRNVQWEADCARTLASLSQGLMLQDLFENTFEW